jgi:hypothetical protein
MLAPPLREERGLAVARGGLHHDDGAVAERVAAGLQALARQLVARHPRRRDLEEEIVGRAHAV